MGLKSVWQIQEARARLGQLIRLAERDGPQVIMHHGDRIAVVLSEAAYERLQRRKRSIVELFSRFDLGDVDFPGR